MAVDLAWKQGEPFVQRLSLIHISLQHEYGIFGGQAGRHILELLRDVRMPVVTTLHTVLREPNAQQKKVMDEIIRRSDRVVVMADKGAEILREVYACLLYTSRCV